MIWERRWVPPGVLVLCVRPSGRPSVKILITKKRFAGPTILKIEYGFRYAKNGTGAIPSQTHVFVSRKTTVPSVSLKNKDVRKPKRTQQLARQKGLLPFGCFPKTQLIEGTVGFVLAAELGKLAEQSPFAWNSGPFLSFLLCVRRAMRELVFC